jgi:hypothetical protein
MMNNYLGARRPSCIRFWETENNILVLFWFLYQKKTPVVAFDVIDLAVELDWTSGSGQVALMNRM